MIHLIIMIFLIIEDLDIKRYTLSLEKHIEQQNSFHLIECFLILGLVNKLVIKITF